MIFVADENIDTDIIESLRKYGINIISISEDHPSIPDSDVLEISNRHKAVLITADKDFGELVFRRGEVSEGVILLRIFGISQEQKASLVLEVFKNHLNEFRGCFTVITKDKIRVKKMN